MQNACQFVPTDEAQPGSFSLGSLVLDRRAVLTSGHLECLVMSQVGSWGLGPFGKVFMPSTFMESMQSLGLETSSNTQ